MTTLRYAFITASRAELYAVSRTVFSALPDGILHARARPLLVAVKGALESGKKIIADSARETLLDRGSATMRGKEGFDEYWHGTRNGHAVEIDYIDMAYPYRRQYSERLGLSCDGRPYPSRPQGDDREAKMCLFLAQREKGGVTFLQNLEEDMLQPDLTFYIERHNSLHMRGYDGPHHRNAPPPLRALFAHVVRHNYQWARYVQLDVHNRRLHDPLRVAAPQLRRQLQTAGQGLSCL